MTNWHSLGLTEIYEQLQSSERGLTAVEAQENLKEFGPNALPKEKPYSKIRLFLRQFNSPLMYILFVTVIISFFMRHFSDAIFIVVVLFIDTSVGFYQENKANNSLLALKRMVKIKAKVLRGGYEKEIDSEELVQGDVILLNGGTK